MAVVKGIIGTNFFSLAGVAIESVDFAPTLPVSRIILPQWQ
ncbi:hypothetical protein OCL06_07205 [Alteromonas sp. ASW11-19]|uniref:Uncharacterized protein n=1 Tax=Alteromonas salexigens TaxID=2982530 RepID=A0ABT2VM42_9ALTE|nr:hypothetical protein [Alteromonas salexigens]MCU7554382.1 hypothetical protein [Alteromonas salexigens]